MASAPATTSSRSGEPGEPTRPHYRAPATAKGSRWLWDNLRTILTALTLLIAVGIAYGRIEARQETVESRQMQLEIALARKVDRDPLLRELDQLHREVGHISSRLDGLIIRQAILADE